MCLWVCHRHCWFSEPGSVLISGITWVLLLCGEEKKKGWEPVPISCFHKYWSCWFELHQRNRKASKTLSELASLWLPVCIPSSVCVCKDEREHNFQRSCSANRSGCRGTAQGLTPGSVSPSHCITAWSSCPQGHLRGNNLCNWHRTSLQGFSNSE